MIRCDRAKQSPVLGVLASQSRAETVVQENKGEATMSEENDKNCEERRAGKDRRKRTTDRRQQAADTSAPDFVERRSGQDRRNSVVDRRLGLDRRRGPGRRRSDERKAAEEGQMSDEQFEFVMAIDEYKRANNRPFPTWTEVLEIIRALGYRKVAEPQALAGAPTSEKEKKSKDSSPKRTPLQSVG